MINDENHCPHCCVEPCISVTAVAVVYHPATTGNIQDNGVFVQLQGGEIDVHHKVFAVY